MDVCGLSESSQGELSRQQERALLEKTFQPYNNYKQSIKVKVGKQYFSLRWLSLLMLNFSLIHFYNQEEITFIILFTDPLPCDVASYKADFEGLGVANLKLKNAYALSGVNPSKFTICFISFSRYLDYCTWGTASIFSRHCVRKGEEPFQDESINVNM